MSRRNTTFYAKAVSDTRPIRVKDVFSSVFQKHTRGDLDNAFTAGLKDHIPEGGAMLEVWQKPWIFSRVLVYGVLAWVIVLVLNLFGDMDQITLGAQFIVPAVVVPFAVVMFYWELNIPRNIPIYDIIKFILFGGIIASVVNGIFYVILNAGEVETASVAGLTEELTKLVIIAFILRRRDRCWGLNGLLIGAAVGAGFAIFETNGYAISTLYSDGFEEAVRVLNMRGMLAVCGHVAYSAMYGGTLALAKGRESLSARHFVNPYFLITFFSAMLLHALWNADFIYDFLTGHGDYLNNIANLLYGHYYIGIGLIFTLIEYAIIFWVIRMSVRQVVQYALQVSGGEALLEEPQAAYPAYNGQPVYNAQPSYADAMNPQPAYSVPLQPVYGAAPYETPAQPAVEQKSLVLECVSGELAGNTYRLEPGRTLGIGRGKENLVKYPDDTRGISGKHCTVGFDGEQAVITDLDSSFGTFFPDGRKLKPNFNTYMNDGDSFYLAGERNSFRIHIQPS